MKFSNSDINYWFTADTHINHSNIIKGISNWEDKSGCRDFANREEHNWNIINNTNKYVKPNDVLFHLGDLSFGGVSSIWWFRKQLNVKEIHFVIGNHDRAIQKNKELIIPEEDHELAKIIANVWYMHGKDLIVPAQELFSSVQEIKNTKFFGHRVTMCHYAMSTWYYHNKGSIMLFAHSHDSLHPPGKTMDVGVDVAKRMLGSYRPFKWQEIQKIMSKKEVHIEDGHTTKTNPQ